MADPNTINGYTVDELIAIANSGPDTTAASSGLSFEPAPMSMMPPAPEPGQLASSIYGPTRAPTPVELGVAELMTRSPLEQEIAYLQGAKLGASEGASFGVFPKVEALGESLKSALFLQNPIEQFKQVTEQQDILKEFYRQKALERQATILGTSPAELAGSLVSPVGILSTAKKVRAGAPLAEALLTRGANIAKATATGAGTTALQTFLSTPGSVEDRVAKAQEVASTAAALTGGMSTLGETISAASPKLMSFGKAARRAALGATKADYKKTANPRQMVIDSQKGAVTLTEKGLDNVIEKGYLGNTTDPALMLRSADDAIDTLDNQLQTKITDVEKSGVKVKSPNFQRLIDKIDAGEEFTVEMQDALKARVKEIEDKLNERGGGKLSYLQNQKRAYGKLYNPVGTSAEAQFNRDIYHALQKEIEKYVPEAKSLNEEIQSIIVTKPILERRVADTANFAGKVFDRIGKSGFTTGGALGTAYTLATGSGPLGILASALTGAIASKPGMEAIGKSLQKSPELAQALTAAGIRLGAATRPEIQPMQFGQPATTPTADNLINGYTVDELIAIANSGNEPSATPTPTAAPETIKIGKQDISIPQGEKFAPANLVKAVIKVESGGKAKAVSPKGASGLMQLMPGTAKELGVTDVFDPQQNVEAGSKYLNQQIDEFGDQKLALAAYNWGPGNMAAARRKLESKGIDFTWSNLLKYVSVPNETENYVNKVMSLI